MTGEIEKGGVKVFPAMIADCEVPATLSARLHADFRQSYYRGLRQLFEVLCPEFYKREKFVREGQIESAAQQLKELLPSNDLEALRKWFSLNGYALEALFRKLWSVTEAIPRLAIEDDTADFIVINGESSRYELTLIMLGSPTWSGVDNDERLKECERLQGWIRWCRGHDQNVRRSLALRMASTEAAEQLAPRESSHKSLGVRSVFKDSDSPYGRGHRLKIDGKLLCGRREEYGRSQNSFRNDVYWKFNQAIDIMSYDRVVDALGKVGDDG